LATDDTLLFYLCFGYLSLVRSSFFKNTLCMDGANREGRFEFDVPIAVPGLVEDEKYQSPHFSTI